MVSLHHVFSGMNDAIFAIDSMCRVVYHNKTFGQLFQRGSSKLLDRRCYEVVCGRTPDGQDICCPDCPVGTSLLRGRAVGNFEMAVPSNCDSPVLLSVSGVPAPPVFFDKAAVIFMLRPMTASVTPVLAFDNKEAIKPDLSDEPGHMLTAREKQILRLLAEGASARAVAGDLHISYVTARNHIQHLYAKLGVHNRAQAVSYAHRHGLLA